jgi:peptide/nickel transport system permease protein
MMAYISRRILMLPIVTFFATLLLYSLISILPAGVRAVAFVGEDPRALRNLSAIIEKYHLNDPLPVQYWNWITQVMQGNWGYSQAFSMKVTDALVKFVPATLELVLMTLFPLIALGIWMGVKSAVNHNRFMDQATRFMSITGWSLPTFVCGLVLLMVFYGILAPEISKNVPLFAGWFAPGRLSNEYLLIVTNPKEYTVFTGMFTVDSLLNGRWDIFWNALGHMILPAITLSYVSWALLVRITRSSMLNALREDYVTTARAKGLAEKVVIDKHAKRNAMIPVITISGFLVGGLMSGVAITETIFNYKGLGKFFVESATRLDIPAVLGFTIFSGLLWVVTNLVVDILYSYIDPRVRLD